ncbi:TIGR02530 family flagellar biosynthesis protein [Gracilibacillus kekensis]|uniref:Flagellar operon protein n=1 Tax=Gracilibacillus kekensis TaxID=1027249 RepID=A0A1M7PGS8_9BACI|nr:TIGR02530 family flagellar biosynthesis protein [Gracilibacillus kekensis]SHN16250.1 flagellar operon protein [Gracilibacillus kekensis]
MDHRIHALHPTILPNQQNNKKKNVETSFKEILGQQQPIQISKHAEQRMASRNIEITIDKWYEMESKLEEASKKGVRDSLVITDEAAFIVNAKNKTVITAMEKSEMKSKIFTNINGTILID